MGNLGKWIIAAALLGLAACNDPSRLGDGMGGAAAGSGTFAPGSASDPRSPIFFQEAIGDRVFFANDQSGLSPEARATLDGQSQWLLTNTDYTAVIEGHADEKGTREYNLALGARRANTVREYLVTSGVPASRLKTISYGKERPIEICSVEACYSKNRRAVTVLAGGLTG
ncbi:peptidoglycan-associated lipoprotein Pal [Pontibaca salina]|uniref:Peptidoglycan-associated lipoprotein n=1 Tax=Pontibaca salina TaxID=2795731 RepID=A0A934HNG4_9RHOB|nr:peptidoglycan-associated lipoprotein Pal [Pontibaca salina]MBI6628612.1 peptidoglycan-associated lipoprotein Pal [Pontibaca salina]